MATGFQQQEYCTRFVGIEDNSFKDLLTIEVE
jgi:hypothetical protein